MASKIQWPHPHFCSMQQISIVLPHTHTYTRNSLLYLVKVRYREESKQFSGEISYHFEFQAFI